MRVNDLACDATDVLVADAGVVFTLWIWEAGFRETKWLAVFVKKVFLLETEPSARIIRNVGSRIRGVWRLLVRHVNFAHDECAVFLGAIRVNGYRFEHAVRAFTFGLTSRATVK